MLSELVGRRNASSAVFFGQRFGGYFVSDYLAEIWRPRRRCLVQTFINMAAVGEGAKSGGC